MFIIVVSGYYLVNWGMILLYKRLERRGGKENAFKHNDSDSLICRAMTCKGSISSALCLKAELTFSWAHFLSLKFYSF